MVPWFGPLNGEAEKIHENSIESVAISPDGQWLAAGTFGRVHLWRLSDGALLFSWMNHAEWVVSIAFSPDSQTLATGSFDNTIKLWSVTNGTLSQTLTRHVGVARSVAFSPEGARLASGGGDATSVFGGRATALQSKP